jgi:hypothetical protein
MFSIKKMLWVLPIALFLAVSSEKAEATLYVSNLGNLWTRGGIGDIHGLFPGGIPYGSDTASFTTGPGSFALNAVTLEFEFDSTYPAGLTAPLWLSIQLFQGNSLLGGLGHPAADPMPTQWPQSSNPNAYTQFIDFSPLQPITLNPLTQYSIVANMPSNSPVSAALLFTQPGDSAYNSVAGWIQGPTTSGDFAAFGEYLMMAVDASPVPEPNAVTLALVGSMVLIGRWKFLSQGRKESLDVLGRHT